MNLLELIRCRLPARERNQSGWFKHWFTLLELPLSCRQVTSRQLRCARFVTLHSYLTKTPSFTSERRIMSKFSQILYVEANKPSHPR